MDVLTALEQHRDSSCAVCGLLEARSLRYLEGIARDGVNDIPLRQRLRKQGGYCARHAKLFADQSLLLPTAILLKDMLDARLERVIDGNTKPIRCEACQLEADYLEHLIKHIRKHKQAAEAVLMTLPLCLTHLTAVCKPFPKPVREKLIRRFDVTDAHLSEVIRKHDYRFQDEAISKDERASVEVVLGLLETLR
ncbi:MAG: hypothetical protein AAF267_04310 [Deinococcota bacterium]